MKVRIFITALAALLLTACSQALEKPWPQELRKLSVTAVYEDASVSLLGASVKIEETSSGAIYSTAADAVGKAEIQLPCGIYRISISERSGRDVYNGTAEQIILDEDRSVTVRLSHSKAGSLVIRELYVGGCSKAPQEGTYQSDQYVILHNNDSQTCYLDSLCFGTLSPYNSTSVNNWITHDPVSGEIVFPDFAPVVTVVWKFPGNGSSWPLAPGEDALIALRGAIDHSAAYPLSVNLNREDCFVCYNPTYFPNPLYHPAPGDKIRQDHILEVLIKTGQANANTVSLSSPTFVIFKTQGVAAEDYVLREGVVQVTPGNSADRVVVVPYEWIIDAVEVFDGRSSGNNKRLAASADAGFVTQSDIHKGHSLIRKVDEEASSAAGFEILADTNNSSNDFYESDIQSLHD